MRLAVVVLLLLSGCALYQPQPDEKHVRSIEERLEGHPCIGHMSTWARQYYHPVRRYLDRSIELADTDTIQFEFREAGRFGRRAGKTILPPGGDGMLDERDYVAAYGKFQPATGKLTITDCGPAGMP